LPDFVDDATLSFDHHFLHVFNNSTFRNPTEDQAMKLQRSFLWRVLCALALPVLAMNFDASALAQEAFSAGEN
jgi:hypothetical protein